MALDGSVAVSEVESIKAYIDNTIPGGGGNFTLEQSKEFTLTDGNATSGDVVINSGNMTTLTDVAGSAVQLDGVGYIDVFATTGITISGSSTIRVTAGDNATITGDAGGNLSLTSAGSTGLTSTGNLTIGGGAETAIGTAGNLTITGGGGNTTIGLSNGNTSISQSDANVTILASGFAALIGGTTAGSGGINIQPDTSINIGNGGGNATLGVGCGNVSLTMNDGNLSMSAESGKFLTIANLPTSDPSVPGALWNSVGVVMISS